MQERTRTTDSTEVEESNVDKSEVVAGATFRRRSRLGEIVGKSKIAEIMILGMLVTCGLWITAMVWEQRLHQQEWNFISNRIDTRIYTLFVDIKLLGKHR